MRGPPLRKQTIGINQSQLLASELRATEVFDIPSQYTDRTNMRAHHRSNTRSRDMFVFAICMLECGLVQRDIPHIGSGKLRLHVLPFAL